MSTKIDLIIRAYKQGRISGLTTKPSPDEMVDGFEELEDMMALWFAANIDVGYRFDDTLDDINAEAGVERWAVPGIVAGLCKRLCDYFAKPVHPSTDAKARSGLTVIQQKTYQPTDVQRPSRMPRGSGNNNKQDRFYRFYPDTFNPLTDRVWLIAYKDVNDYKEDFSAYLNEDETIANYEISAPDSLSVVSDSSTDEAVDYRLTAIVNGALNQQLLIKIVTSDGREQTRFRYFTVRTVSPDNL